MYRCKCNWRLDESLKRLWLQMPPLQKFWVQSSILHHSGIWGATADKEVINIGLKLAYTDKRNNNIDVPTQCSHDKILKLYALGNPGIRIRPKSSAEAETETF
jgi:hypothetical protein